MGIPLLIVVDDDPGMTKMISTAGESLGYNVLTVNTATEFQELLPSCNPTCIVMDLVMPDVDGIELLNWMSQFECSAQIVLISGYGGKYLDIAEAIASGNKCNIVAKLEKPFRITELDRALEKALESSKQ